MKKKKANKKKGFVVVAWICAIGFAACIVWLISYYKDLQSARRELEAMRENYVTEEVVTVSESVIEVSENEVLIPEEEAEGYPGIEDYDVPVRNIDFAALHEENEHIYAWIHVPGTVIDYPVLQHPEDNAFYLEHNVDGSAGYPGCIYTENFNSTAWDDPNTVLYGHNMRDGSMFANLHYFEDGVFFEENRFIYIYTPEEILVYEIFAAYEFSNVHLLIGIDTHNEENFGRYLEGIYQNEGINNHFDESIEVTSEDRIITLATCIAGKPNKRFLVQGVLTAIGTTDE